MTGIWAELLLIKHAKDPIDAVSAWRAEENSFHDLTAHGFHVEVKATATTEGRHHFSAAQLQPKPSVAVASLVLEYSDLGVSVMDLYDAVMQRLADSSTRVAKVQKLVVSLVGRRLPEAENTRYDESTALCELNWYEASDIPALDPPFPAGISRVQFESDLSSASSLSTTAANRSDLWRNLAHRNLKVEI